jgi:tRNA A37 threonylcarbamoyladenosine dehydratase
MLNPELNFQQRLHSNTDSGWQSRTRLLIGDEGADALAHAHVLVVGQGGVGSFASEFLVRAGLGRITIVDGDVVDSTNRNRQLPALLSTEGKFKVDVMRARLQDINPDVHIVTIREFLDPSRMERLLSTRYDYVVDAIDSVTPKIFLLATAYARGLRVVSSMGAGGRIDPTQIRVGDLMDTQKCSLARFVRKRIRRKGVDRGIKAVYSLEEVNGDALMYTDNTDYKKSAYGTISYLPAAFGGACASVVVRDISNYPPEYPTLDSPHMDAAVR